MAKGDLGPPSGEPCRVCGQHQDNQMEPRFCYTVCWTHRDVPPASLTFASGQYKKLGKTQWDRS
jgi:hypothetical protein